MTRIDVTLHDGSTLTATTIGSGPALLLPVRSVPHEQAAAETMRQWGGDPDLGPSLIAGLSADHQVIAADYEAHRMSHPAPDTLTPDAITADLLAVADAAGVDRFAYYGYSWLALAGFQLALRTERLWALAMGGFPPAGGPYEAMRAVTRAAHERAVAPPEPVDAAATVAPGDWDSASMDVDPGVTRQFVTLYESLRGFDDIPAQRRLSMPRLAFAGDQDEIGYGPKWGDTVVRIAEPLRRHQPELTSAGWTVRLLPDLDHMSAMHSARVLPLLGDWLREHRPH